MATKTASLQTERVVLAENDAVHCFSQGSLLHYDQASTISEDDRKDFLLAIFRLAQENHLGCIRLMFKLLDMRMPHDWDNREHNRLKWRVRKPVTEQQIIHRLCIED